jgi:hypothetical protein
MSRKKRNIRLNDQEWQRLVSLAEIFVPESYREPRAPKGTSKLAVFLRLIAEGKLQVTPRGDL